MKPLPLTSGAFFVSSTFLDTLSRCARESEYYKLDARIKAQTSSGLNFGAHCHSAFELHYRLTEFNLSPSEVHSSVVRLLEKEFDSSPNQTDDFRTLNWAIEIYQNFARKFQFESFNLLHYKEPQPCGKCSPIIGSDHPQGECIWCCGTGKRKVMTEVPFVVKLYDHNSLNHPSLPVYFHGYIDLPIQLGHQFFILDFKTTLMLGDSYWDTHRVSAQQKGYCYGFQQTTGLKVSGHIIRALRTSPPTKAVREGKPNRAGVVQSALDWWDESLVEQTFYLGQGELDAWRHNTIEQLERFFWHYQRGYFPESRTSCTHKYGKCQYYDVCNTFPTSTDSTLPVLEQVVADRDLLLSSGLYMTKEPRTPQTQKEQNDKTINPSST